MQKIILGSARSTLTSFWRGFCKMLQWGTTVSCMWLGLLKNNIKSGKHKRLGMAGIQILSSFVNNAMFSRVLHQAQIRKELISTLQEPVMVKNDVMIIYALPRKLSWHTFTISVTIMWLKTKVIVTRSVYCVFLLESRSSEHPLWIQWVWERFLQKWVLHQE